MIEWLDSAQPVSGWAYLSDIDMEIEPVRCASVGWLIHKSKTVHVLAPNMGQIHDERQVQACGVIRIPTCCVVSVQPLKEPSISSVSGPSSRPAKGRKRQGTAPPSRSVSSDR